MQDVPRYVHATTISVPDGLSVDASLHVSYEFEFKPKDERAYTTRCLLGKEHITTTHAITSSDEFHKYISALPEDVFDTYVVLVWPTNLQKDARLRLDGKFVHMSLESVTNPKQVGWCITGGNIDKSDVQFIAFRTDWTSQVFADPELILPEWGE